MRRTVVSMFVLLLIASALPVPPGWARVAVSLRGSPDSMTRQNKVATGLGFIFAETAADVDTLVARGELVPVVGNADYEVLDGVSFPFARPEVRLFIERLAGQYHEATGEKLVVTSLTRPSDGQPKNASALSVHPAGIAIDLRVSERAASRQWLEAVLLSLERRGVLDVTREHRPPHYHLAVFPEAYLGYLEGVIGAEAVALALQPPLPAADTEAAPDDSLSAPRTQAMAAALVMTVPERAGERRTMPVALPAAAAALLLLAYWQRRRGAPAAG